MDRDEGVEKDRSRRYETASKFAEDVEHYLAGDTVEACPPSTAYRLRKFASRNKAILATATAIMLVLVLGFITSKWFAVEAAKQRDVATDLGEQLKEEARISKANEQEAVSAKRTVEEAKRLQRRQLYVSDTNRTFRMLDEGNILLADTLLRRHVRDNGEEDLRASEWYYLRRRAKYSQL